MESRRDADSRDGALARERRCSHRHRPAQRGETAYFPVPRWRTSRHLPHPAERPGNAGVHTGTAPRSGARRRTFQFRDGARLGTYPTRQSGTPAWNAGLRPASRGSAKPATMTLRHANVSSPPSPNPEWRNCSPLRPTPGPRLFMTGGGCRRARSWAFLPVGARRSRGFHHRLLAACGKARFAGDASRLNRPASRGSQLRFGRITPGPVLPVGAPPSRALSAGPPPGELGLARLGAHMGSTTGC